MASHGIGIDRQRTDKRTDGRTDNPKTYCYPQMLLAEVWVWPNKWPRRHTVEIYRLLVKNLVTALSDL